MHLVKSSRQEVGSTEEQRAGEPSTRAARSHGTGFTLRVHMQARGRDEGLQAGARLAMQGRKGMRRFGADCAEEKQEWQRRRGQQQCLTK